MHSLSDLQAGKLIGAKELRITNAGLCEFPNELFDLSETLEILDLSGNHLSALPEDFPRLKKLRVLFVSNNEFEVVPTILAECPALSMVGFKANRITTLAENALPKDIRWLILTDNKIKTLPISMGQHIQLQKLMLAGNQISALPVEMENCKKLELLRISANNFKTLPEWLFQLPRLAWLAFAGNPCSEKKEIPTSLPEVHWHELELGERIGEGASGLISKAFWKQDSEVAVKEFKGSVTSDGYPTDEMSAAMHMGEHPNLIEVIGRIASHPEQKEGLLLSLISDDFSNLAEPPCLDSCTRDCYGEGQSFSLLQVLNIAEAISSAAMHLHERGLMHGDLYGHNILINSSAECLLGDFGAASHYHPLNLDINAVVEKIEVRAFSCLLEELLARIKEHEVAIYDEIILKLHALQESCHSENNSDRPVFSDIYSTLSTLKNLS